MLDPTGAQLVLLKFGAQATGAQATVTRLKFARQIPLRTSIVRYDSLRDPIEWSRITAPILRPLPQSYNIDARNAIPYVVHSSIVSSSHMRFIFQTNFVVICNSHVRISFYFLNRCTHMES